VGHPTYHVNVIKIKWEIIWTSGLPHLSGLLHGTGVPYLYVNRSLVNIFGEQSNLPFSLKSNHKKEKSVVPQHRMIMIEIIISFCSIYSSFFIIWLTNIVFTLQVEGKGNGIKTVIVNMVEIAKALQRPPACKIAWTVVYVCLFVFLLLVCLTFLLWLLPLEERHSHYGPWKQASK